MLQLTGGRAAHEQDHGEALLERFAHRPDPALRRQIVERYLPLVRFAAFKRTPCASRR